MGALGAWTRRFSSTMLTWMLDSRTTLRYPIDLPARVLVGETELSARIRNLSLGGVYIIGPSLPIGTSVHLRFSPPGFDEVATWCIARWTADDGCGLAFDGLRAIDTYELARFIRTASRATQRLPANAIRPPAP